MIDAFLQIETSQFWTFNWYYIVAILISLTAVIIGYKNYKKKHPHNVETKPLEISMISENNPIAWLCVRSAH